MTKDEALQSIAAALETCTSLEDLKAVDTLVRARWSTIKSQATTAAVASGIREGSPVEYVSGRQSGKWAGRWLGKVIEMNRTSVSMLATLHYPPHSRVPTKLQLPREMRVPSSEIKTIDASALTP